MPTDDGKYVLDADVLNESIGAVLSQIQEGEERVIAFTCFVTCREKLLHHKERVTGCDSVREAFQTVSAWTEGVRD